MTVAEFCDLHNACDEGREWALANCLTMQEAWNHAKPEWLVWIATRKGVLTEKEQRLFACWAARQVWHLLTDERSRTAVEVAERFANGEATSEEMAAAESAARSAAESAARSVVWSVVWSAQATYLRKLTPNFSK